jgi:hypothetical protein
MQHSSHTLSYQIEIETSQTVSKTMRHSSLTLSFQIEGRRIFLKLRLLRRSKSKCNNGSKLELQIDITGIATRVWWLAVQSKS